MTRPSCSRQLAGRQLHREFYGGARLYRRPNPSGPPPSGSEGRSHLFRSRGMPPRTVQGQGSAAKHRYPSAALMPPRRGMIGQPKVDVHRCSWNDGSGSIRSFATPCRLWVIRDRAKRTANPAMSASLIGRLGSSTFRLSTTTVSMSLTGSCFSSESAPRPFHYGIRRRGGTIYATALPSHERQVQADMRTHLIHRPARDIIPPLGGTRVSFYWI